MSLTEVKYYYDDHPTEEDLLGESERQETLSDYLKHVLKWLFHEEKWYIPRNLNLHRTDEQRDYPFAPDVAVFKGHVLPDDPELEIKSWRVHDPEKGPPDVVFEIASEETWKKDIQEKPDWYAEAGVKEYFFYDPRPRKKVRGPRLRGWRGVQGQPEPMEPGEGGRLWSEELNSWLVPDGRYLRLLDPAGEQRPTAEEAAIAAAAAAIEAEDAARQSEQAARLSEQAARRQAEAERAARERAWAKLRELGVDPETL